MGRIILWILCVRKVILLVNDFNNKEYSLSSYCNNGLDNYLIERINLYENKK